MPLPHSPPEALGSVWTSQLESLHSALACQPEHPQAWRWRIQIKVLTFLVSRYGASLSVEQKKHEPSRRVLPEDVLLVTRSRPLRSRRSFRQTLQHIEAVNPHWPSGPGPISPKPLRWWEVPYTLEDVARFLGNRSVQQQLPPSRLLSYLGYLLLALCLAAPYLWLLFTIVSAIAMIPRP